MPTTTTTSHTPLQPDYRGRIQALQTAMLTNGVDLVILDFSANFSYLTGIPYPRSSPRGDVFSDAWLKAALITPDHGPILAASSRVWDFTELAADRPWISDVQTLDGIDDPAQVARRLLDQCGQPTTIAVSRSLGADALLAFQRAAPDAEFRLAEPLLWPQRQIKDAYEMACLEQSAQMTDQIFASIRPMLQSGVARQQVADEINAHMLQLGASGNAFETAVILNGPGFGGRSDPDRYTTIETGCMVAFDFGMVYNGYCSDFGRSVIIGEPLPLFEIHHRMLREARDAAVAHMRPGVKACDVHAQIHRVFADYGWEEEGRVLFGHGLGLDIHEPPYLNAWDQRPLAAGMVMTVEPRAYRDGIVGGRIEDMVRITADGAEPLTRYPLDLLVVEG